MGIVKQYKCRVCDSENIVKNGKTKYGQQKYHCKDCKTHKTLKLKPRYTVEFIRKYRVS